ncbi:hypothetical protein PIB30_043368 [Stylosanthes scabra]|uniref:Bowman-Birk serine protease inhibitors family domain-containing protein n=1 Tax=Stylosanthes scabra TaxID=79078 RepID=A0ABU6XH84_9FABA|nr:hypothetical protein [Stylosanthes scabra]
MEVADVDANEAHLTVTVAGWMGGSSNSSTTSFCHFRFAVSSSIFLSSPFPPSPVISHYNHEKLSTTLSSNISKTKTPHQHRLSSPTHVQMRHPTTFPLPRRAPPPKCPLPQPTAPFVPRHSLDLDSKRAIILTLVPQSQKRIIITATINGEFDRIPRAWKEAEDPNGDGDGDGDGNEKPCCDSCMCSTMTRGTCQCRDVSDACPVYCENCICTSPRHCRCHDELEFCDPPCEET